jgi:ubiquinone/menaquinone biosynthesis C-methylase UbiE
MQVCTSSHTTCTKLLGEEVDQLTNKPQMSAVEHWEMSASTRWGQYITAAETAMIERALKEAPFPRRALDVGCGGGRWTRHLLDHGCTVTSVDVDQEAVDTTAARNPTATCLLVNARASAWPVADRSVSLIACIEVLPVSHSDWFFEEARRVLTQGGQLVTVAWNKSSLRGQVGDAFSRIRDRTPHPYYQSSYRAWRRNLRTSGFRVEAEHGLCWFPFGRASDSRWIPISEAAERRLHLSSFPTASPWVIVTATRV